MRSRQCLKSAAWRYRLLGETIGNENAAMNLGWTPQKRCSTGCGKSTQPIDGEVDAVLQILFSDSGLRYAK